MRSDKTRPAGIALVAFGLLATLVLLAGPAAANPDAEPGKARDNSVTSGEAGADNGSTGSGCGLAENGSTASGGVCPADPVVEKVALLEELVPAPAATANGAKSLALTGSSTLPLAAGAAGLVLVGGLMMVATTDRRRALSHS